MFNTWATVFFHLWIPLYLLMNLSSNYGAFPQQEESVLSSLGPCPVRIPMKSELFFSQRSVSPISCSLNFCFILMLSGQLLNFYSYPWASILRKGVVLSWFRFIHSMACPWSTLYLPWIKITAGLVLMSSVVFSCPDAGQGFSCSFFSNNLTQFVFHLLEITPHLFIEGTHLFPSIT